MRYTTYHCRRVIVVLAMFLPLTSHAQISLVERGKPAAQIVLTDTTHAARRAAEVMNYFVEKLTGTTLHVGLRAEKKPRQIVFIGGKMLAVPWFHIPIQWSLSIVGCIILISVVLSLALSKKGDDLSGESS